MPNELAVLEGVVGPGALVEDFTGAVFQLTGDLHGLPVSGVAEQEVPVRAGAQRRGVDVVVVGQFAQIVEGVGEVFLLLGQARERGLPLR
jgi:hypothetical protein